MAEILVVDDDENMCSAFKQFLEAEGHTPIIAANAEDGVKAATSRRPDLVFMDIRMPGAGGLEAMKQIRAAVPDITVVVMTAFSTSQTSIEAVKLGAFEYLHKPLDLDDVRHVIDKALTAQSLSRKTASVEEDEWEKYSLVNLVGANSRMREVYRLIGLLTTNDIPALIIGERGTGKHLAAQAIHYNSSRRDRPFVSVDCQMTPAETLEMELFGHSGAGGRIPYGGQIRKAEGGTLFAEEIQLLPPAAQNKLLRYLKEKVYEPVAGSGPLKSDVRILAASSRDFSDQVKQTFNPELYDRLVVIRIDLPPLRERMDDMPQLVTHFIRRHNNELQKNIRGIDDRSLVLLRNHVWPGNVAELENVLKRACILARSGVLTVDDIQDALEGGSTPLTDEILGRLEAAARDALQQKLLDTSSASDLSVFHEIVAKVELALVREALKISGGNQVKAAEMLGLNRTTLRKKISLDEAPD